jgi:glucose-1-phosphate cytidylyltransferase
MDEAKRVAVANARQGKVMTKAVILAGGLGTRFGGEAALRPKPLIEVGGRPVLWHIMKLYEFHGICDFIICTGYRTEAIADFFLNYRSRFSDLDVDLANGTVQVLRSPAENWRVKIIDTGPLTATGGRLKRIAPLVETDEYFLMTYGDTLTNVDVSGSTAYHRSHGRLATMSVVSPQNRFGKVTIEDGAIVEYREKQSESPLQLNAGFFVLSPKVLSYIDNDTTIWEKGPLEQLARNRQLMAWRHEGFWQPMDTAVERDGLNRLWETGQAPWRVW